MYRILLKAGSGHPIARTAKDICYNVTSIDNTQVEGLLITDLDNTKYLISIREDCAVMLIKNALSNGFVDLSSYQCIVCN